jgi:mannose-6-phosphate isomerase-like protein (cupin superfamily)
MATNAMRTASGTFVPLDKQEPILSSDRREIGLLVAGENLSITEARYAAGEGVAGPHIHHQHTDAFYVLEGKLTFEIGPGPEPERVTVGAGGFVAAPPGLAHSFRTADGQPARWLTIHAHDGGYADFMRGIRDGVQIDWDIAPVPADGGLPADHAIVSRPVPETPPSQDQRALATGGSLADRRPAAEAWG